MEVIAILSLVLEEEHCKRNTRLHLRNIRDTSNPFEQSTAHFKTNFRLSKENASYLIEKLQPFYEETSSIPFELKVLTALHFYGHGSYQKSIGSNSMLGLSQPSVSRCIKMISGLIEKHLGPILIQFPCSEEKKQQMKERFFSTFNIPNIVGCIDGTHIAIAAPPQYDPVRPSHLYMNRKGYFSINAEMIVDADMRYLWVNPKFPGSAHDSDIWATSPARDHLKTAYTERSPFMLLGDSGYPLEPWLFTPFDSNTTNPAEVLYNQLHKTTRNIAERTFGATKTRFRCLLKHRPLHYYPPIAATIINALCTLHNLCINHNDVFDENADDSYDGGNDENEPSDNDENADDSEGGENGEADNDENEPAENDDFIEGRRLRSAYAQNLYNM